VSVAKDKKRILIAGGGIGGMAMALGLLRQGHSVQVFEQAPELKELGAGLHMSPNGFCALDWLGVGDAILDRASLASGRVVRLWSTGESWKVLDVGEKARESYGFPYVTLYRPDLHDVLIDAVRALDPHAVQLGATCTGFEQDASGVRLEVGNRTVTGDALIGADGIHSKIREGLHGKDQPHYSGIMAWRMMVRIDQLPEHLRAPVATNWIGPGGHCVHYPVKSGELLNFIGIRETDQWLAESWTQRGTVEDCLATFEGWHQDVQTLIKGGMSHFKWALMLRDPLSFWSKGRVTLLGDACHSMLPFMAQGAAMALEDAVILARALEAHADIATAFEKYEAVRRERTRRVINGSAENAKRFHNPALAEAAGAREYVNREFTEEKLRQRYDWLYTYNAQTEPV
jgi:salicylate hydroxylase